MSTLLKFEASSEQETPIRSRITTRNFSFVVDEPKELGGTDEAPNPVEYLLGSYAGCLHVVANIVAKEQKLDVGKIKISISGELDPNRFLTASTGSRAGYQSLKVDISTSNSIPSEASQRFLAAISDRCPINDTIKNSTPVSINLN